MGNFCRILDLFFQSKKTGKTDVHIDYCQRRTNTFCLYLKRLCEIVSSPVYVVNPI